MKTFRRSQIGAFGVALVILTAFIAPHPTHASSSYTWSYNANGGGGTMTHSQFFSTCSAKNLTTSFPPTRDGFTLIGWSLGSRDGEFLGSGSYTNCTNITLFAQWNYTVTFNANGGSASRASSRNSAAGVALPAATRDGFDLAGWYTAASGGTRVGGTADTYNPNNNVTVFAQWSAPTYTVTYDAHGGTPTPTPEPFTVGGTALTLPTTSRSGYTFDGWYTADIGGSLVGVAEAPFTPIATTTLHAQWTPETYTVTFDGNGGNATPTSTSYTVGDPALTLPTANRSGYTFNGWYTADIGGSLLGTGGANYTPSATTTLYAQWTLVPNPTPGPAPEPSSEPSTPVPTPPPATSSTPQDPSQVMELSSDEASQELRLLLSRNPVLRFSGRLILPNRGLVTSEGVPVRMTLVMQQRDARGLWRAANARAYRVRESGDGLVTIRNNTTRPMRARVTWEIPSDDGVETASVTRVFRIR